MYSGPTGLLGVSLTDPPIVPPGVTDVYISYSSVEVHVADAGNEDGWYQVADAGSVDLMSLVNVSLTLGSAQVQTGVFNLIAFNITSAAVTINGANVTAYVPANRINVPIVGGITVSTGNSSGVLVDLSPEVVPYQNGTSISYVLVPEARSLPIPSNVWSRGLDVKGAKLQEIQNQTWITNATGDVVVTGISVTPNSFSLTLQNQGTTNASFSSITIGQVMSLPQCYATPNSGAPRPAVGNGSYVTVLPEQPSYVGNATVSLVGQVYPPPATANTSASVLVTDPNSNVVESMNSSVGQSGGFNVIFVAGGSVTPWVNGTYNVVVNYNGTVGTTSFQWAPSSVVIATTSSTTNSTTVITSTNLTESTANYTTTTTTTTVSNSTFLPSPANIAVMTNATSYFGNAGILVYGSINPAPAVSNAVVALRVVGPGRALVFSDNAPVGTNGSFSAAFPAGGPANGSNMGGPMWMNGTYIVYAYQASLISDASFQWSGAFVNVTSYTTSSSSWTNTTDGNYSSTRQFQNSFCGLYGGPDRSLKLPPSLTVAYYAILANGTLYPVNYTSLIFPGFVHQGQMRHDKGNNSALGIGGDIMGGALTYTLAPGQSVTFTYNGTIDSLTGILLSYLPRNFAVPSSLFQINVGQEYTVLASGPFDVRVATIVNATSTGS